MKINKTTTDKAEKNDRRTKPSSKEEEREKKFKSALEKSAGARKRPGEQTRNTGASREHRETRSEPKGMPGKSDLSPADPPKSAKLPLEPSGESRPDRGLATAEKQSTLADATLDLKKFETETTEKPELTVEEKRALVSGEVTLAPDSAEATLLRKTAPTAPTGGHRHEVTEALLAKIVNEGYVTEDLKGRKVVLMRVDVPGRGAVNMRLWRRSTGVELRLRADDSKLASDIRQHRGALQSGARERGIEFSRIEVVG